MWWVWILIVIGLCVLYTASRAKIKIEGFESGKTPTDVLKDVKGKSGEVHDSLNVDKYRNDYEDIIIEYDNWAQRKRVLMLANNDMTNKDKLEEFNSISTFIENLNGTMLYLDKKT